MKNLKITIGSDHAGYKLKEFIKKKLKEKNITVYDVGCSEETSCDYPDYAHAAALSLKENKSHFGILMCGSGNGINMAINKHRNIRGALCWTKEIAILARKHNDANVLALPARFLTEKQGWEITEAFIESKFEGGRHTKRVKKIPCNDS